MTHADLQEPLEIQEVTYILELGDEIIVIEHVPARVNTETGERLFAPETVEKIQAIIRLRQAGVTESPAAARHAGGLKPAAGSTKPAEAGSRRYYPAACGVAQSIVQKYPSYPRQAKNAQAKVLYGILHPAQCSSVLRSIRMPARDVFHQAVKHALIKEGWTITDDPLIVEFGGVDLYIDLAAEKLIAAEKSGVTIAVEIKSFLGASLVREFHTALGQFINYRYVLGEKDPERSLYLAIPSDIYRTFFALPFTQGILAQYQVNLLVYHPETQEVREWIR